MQNINKRETYNNQVNVNRPVNNENYSHKLINNFTQPEVGVSSNREFGKDITNLNILQSQNENQTVIIVF